MGATNSCLEYRKLTEEPNVLYTQVGSDTPDSHVEILEGMNELPLSCRPLTEHKDFVVGKWLDKFKSKKLLNHYFWDHWRAWIDRAILPDPTNVMLEPKIVQDVLDVVLLQSLEDFIFKNENENVKNILKNYENISCLCKKVFKIGEFIFHCNECSNDKKATLCLRCFKKSDHRYHSYKMTKSCGVGCCDCGDKNAWKKGVNCQDHCITKKVGFSATDGSLSEESLARARIVFSSALQYCFQITTLSEHNTSRSSVVWDSIKDDFYTRKKMYCIVVFTWATGLMELLCSLLLELVGRGEETILCTPENIQILADHTLTTGRSIIFYSTYSRCINIRRALLNTCPGAPISIYEWPAISHQEFALQLLAWLKRVILPFENLRNVFVKEALNLDNSSTAPVVGGVIDNLFMLWKAADLHWYELFLAGFFSDDITNKLAFAEVFADKYKNIAEARLRPSNPNCYLKNLTREIFTSPVISQHLVAEKDFLTANFQHFYSFYLDAKCSSLPQLKSSLCILLTDMEYLLDFPTEVSIELKTSFNTAFLRALHILRLMQKPFHTVNEHADLLAAEMAVQTHFASVLLKLVRKFPLDRCTFYMVFKKTLKALHKGNSALISSYHSKTKGHSNKNRDYKVSHNVSIFLPLPRFFAGLYLYLPSFSIDINSPSLSNLIKSCVKDVLELILQIHVFLTQERLEPQSLLSMFELNSSALKLNLGKDFFDKDITVLQICASLMDKEEFLINFMSMYELTDFINENIDVQSLPLRRVSLFYYYLDEFLLLLLAIIGERYKPGVGQISSAECIKYELFHWLLLCPLLRSEIDSFLGDLTEMPGVDIDGVLEELATSQKFLRGYELKKEVLNKYNMFFIRYGEVEREAAEKRHREVRNKYNINDACSPPPLCELTPAFASLNSLLHCDVMLHIISTVLNRYMCRKTAPSNGRILHKVLYLIGYALQEPDGTAEKFILCGNKWNIETKLNELLHSENGKSLKELIAWTINKYKLISRDNNLCKDKDDENITDIRIDDKDASSSETSIDLSNKESFYKKVSERKSTIMDDMATLQRNFFNNCKLKMDPNTNGNVSESNPHNIKTVTEICILCKEEVPICLNGPMLVLLAFAQKSPVIPENNCNEFNLSSFSVPNIHINSCGHVIHYSCWTEYVSKCSMKPHILDQLLLVESEGPDNKNSCPLCRTMVNVLVPLLPSNRGTRSPVPFGEWIKSTNKSLNSYEPCQFEASHNESSDSKNMLYCNCMECEDLFFSLTSKLFSNLNCTQTNENTKVLSAFTNWKNVIDENFHLEIGAILASFLKLMKKFRLEEEPQVPLFLYENDAVFVWQSFTVCVRSVQLYLDFVEKPLFGSYSSQQELCLNSIFNLSALCSTYRSPKGHYVMKKMYKKIVSCLINSSDLAARLLDWDCFKLLVFSTMFQHSYEKRSCDQSLTFDVNLLILFLHLKFLQIIMSIKLDENALLSKNDPGHHDGGLGTIISLLKDYNNLNQSEVWKIIKRESLPFLKCSALFYHFASGVPPTEELKIKGGDTFENILTYLGIHHQHEELFGSHEILIMYSSWADQPLIRDLCFQKAAYPKKVSATPDYQKMIDLPDDFYEIIQKAYENQCLVCNDESFQHLYLCFVCGKFVCLNKTCIGHIEPYHNLNLCGRGFFVLLSIERCSAELFSVDYRRLAGLCMYVDKYGQEDPGFRRGNPLRLNREDYAQLKLDWITHNFWKIIGKTSQRHSVMMTNPSFLY